MIEYVPLVVAFLVTYVLTGRWIRLAEERGLVGRDMNKWEEIYVAESGGVAVVVGLSFALFTYLFLKALLWGTGTHVPETYALLALTLYAGFIGFVDDITGWKKGLSQTEKPLLTLPIALPLATVLLFSGRTDMFVPLLGNIDFGLLFPLIVLLGIVGSSNAFNILAGYNGLEAGMGVVILSAQALYALRTNQLWITLLALSGVSSLLAFLIYNRYPAKVFPGDSLTYAVGAYIGALAVLGKMEVFSALLFLLYFLDMGLYIKGRVVDKLEKIEAFGKPREDGTLDEPYDKVYDTTHIAIKVLKKLGVPSTEKNVVFLILGFQILYSALILLIYP